MRAIDQEIEEEGWRVDPTLRKVIEVTYPDGRQQIGGWLVDLDHAETMYPSAQGYQHKEVQGYDVYPAGR